MKRKKTVSESHKAQTGVEKEVEALIKETLKKNRKELDMALIKPLSPNYPFSTNGVYYLIGKMGSGGYIILSARWVQVRVFGYGNT